MSSRRCINCKEFQKDDTNPEYIGYCKVHDNYVIDALCGCTTETKGNRTKITLHNFRGYAGN